MDSYKRFSDENYKHWLQAAESLYILRSLIRDFVENETESFHSSLRGKLKDDICKSKCTLHKCPPRTKKFPICDKCERWKDEILDNHRNKNMDIHWSNCQSHLWPKDKWEVAKVYMLRGIKDHHSYDQFDITSILNFMSHCKYFEPFVKVNYLTKVISVRNKLMHSPDFRLSKKEMDESISNVEVLAKIFEKYAPGLKNISEQIQQFKNILQKCSGQASQNATDSKEETLKLLDKEQHALKEKIEFLTKCYEEDQGTEIKEELRGVRNFLDQNKDLLENLGPQIQRLNEIQEKVNKHEQDINNLYDRVDQLESSAPDPMFTGDVLKFKNFVFEEAGKRNMPKPEFTEECEPSGYRGVLIVNGRTFKGTQVCNNKRNAHQEVAKIALDFMKSHPEWKEETYETPSSAPSAIYYGIVTVVLKNQEVVSDGCAEEKEAIESAYRKLACHFGLEGKTAVQEYFQRCNFPQPQEHSVQKDDKIFCRLQLTGAFPFSDKDGSTKKKQAEQQAAKIALQHLSGLLNFSFEEKACDNYKGFLKERLEAIGLKQPEYIFTCNKVAAIEELEGLSKSEENSQCKIFYGIVTVALNNQEVVSDGCDQKEEATESAYRELASQFGLPSLDGKAAVQEHFKRSNFPLPLEDSDQKDDKFFCKLQLTGDFTFSDKDGSTKKKQAEQQAAKVALQHLSGLFKCSFQVEADKNYKVLLKEQLDILHLKSPVYSSKENGEPSEDMEGPSTSGDEPVRTAASSTTTISKNVSLKKKHSISQECLVTETQDQSLPDIPNKAPRLEKTDINRLLELFHLKPPSVIVKNVSTEKNFICRVEINLDKFMFQNNSDYIGKKETIRKTYLLLGNALGISKPILDESNALMLVKQDFSQKSLTPPKEVFENKKCSLHDITYNIIYDGTGSSEEEAKQDALEKALDTLTLLCGFESLPKSNTVDGTVLQINNLLKTKGQADLIYSLKPTLYKRSVELLFQDYTMESKDGKNKKENQNHLTKRILGLLALEPESNTVSLRNYLDEWFKQKNLKQPVFESIKEVNGLKVTFSVEVSFSNPNWEDSMKVAEEKLIVKLRERLTCLTKKSIMDI
ncbi:uncharacterized protein LOC124378015 isoform X2 [Silurus meridionalis]|uniref:DRBM domain-containing protein n=1 Tax=Silurus meridionalis TaxID=175797 RepID=A0A8T0AG51_SILME|nr:uncharacterized protein LOC124378015 isoform X2 [Silurus meridionalis]KAF7689616.1 hypothetical protein HF521_012969 [Silurus meridionalis]